MKFDVFAAAAAAGVFLIYILLWTLARGKRAAVRFSNVQQLKAAGESRRAKLRRALKFLRIIAILALLTAFARPQKGLETVATSKEGIAIQIALDRSSSMKRPMSYKGKELSRLEAVKLVLEEFIKGNNQDLKGRRNDMIGLISFAGFPEEKSPLTLDHVTLTDFAKTIETASRIEYGTMIGDALYFSVLKLISVDEILRKAGEKNNKYKVKSKVIILLTDGQQTTGGMSPLEAAKFAADNNIKVYAIAIVDDRAEKSFLGRFFSFGNTPLDTSALRQTADLTGGIFAKASSGEALAKIYKEIDKLEKSAFEEKFSVYKEQFPFWVRLGITLLLLEIILSRTILRKIP